VFPVTATRLFAALLVAALAGCGAAEPFMIPTPAVFKHPALDLEPRLPPALRSTQVPVFYVTTRAPAAAGEPGHYTDAAGKRARLGVAQVRLGEEGWTWEQLVASEYGDTLEKPRPGAVESVEETDEKTFVERIDAQLAKANNREVVLYVHGYRVYFDEVTVMMGSWAHYLGRGALATFQWPTGQQFWNYLTDCPRAERYVPDIERTIELLARTRANRINLIAYSCGSPLLGQALARLRARHAQEAPAELARRYRIGNVIFAASDVDLKTFSDEYLPPTLDLARQVIVYASRVDRALGFSSLIAGASRLGRPDVGDLSAKDIERLASDPRFQVVDVTDVRGAHELGGMRGHGYWYANDWVSTDVLLSLRFTATPRTRCLAPTEHRNIWRFGDGYLDCLANRLIEAVPSLRRGATR
jgi:esterase/lipase superfamily enzyme